MSSALGVLRWTPKEFWQATMFEYTAAMRGHLLSKGVKLDQLGGPTTRSDFLEMVREDEARLAAERKQKT